MDLSVLKNPQNVGGYVVSGSGTYSRLVTWDDLNNFGFIDQDSVRAAIKKKYGHSPKKVDYCDPTDNDNVNYKVLGKAPVTIELQFIGSTVTPGPLISASFASKTTVNEEDKIVTSSYTSSFDTTSTVSSNWSTTNRLSVSQKMSATLGFFGSETTVSYEREWQTGGSESFTQKRGSLQTYNIEIPGLSKRTIEEHTQESEATITVNYEASLKGFVCIQFDKETSLTGVEGSHKYFFLDIKDVIAANDRTNSILAAEEIKLRSTSWSETVLKDPVKLTPSPPTGNSQEDKELGAVILASNPGHIEGVDDPSEK